jgi:hypothetical protein
MPCAAARASLGTRARTRSLEPRAPRAACRPGWRCYRLLGFPLSELTGACVSLEDVFGSAGRALTERLRSLSDWDERFDVMEDFLLARVVQGPAVDPGVAWAWQRLQDTGGHLNREFQQVRGDDAHGFRRSADPRRGCHRRSLRRRRPVSPAAANPTPHNRR